MQRVLVLDGSVWSRRAIEAILQGDYRVMSVDKSEEVLWICQSEAPDLLIVDNVLNTPASGIKIVCRVHARNPRIPLLVTSTMPTEFWRDDEVRCFQRLASTARFGFLPKPFSSQQLRAAVADLMKGRVDAGSDGEGQSDAA